MHSVFFSATHGTSVTGQLFSGKTRYQPRLAQAVTEESSDKLDVTFPAVPGPHLE